MKANEMFMELKFRQIKNNNAMIVYVDIENDDFYITFYKLDKAIGGMGQTYDYYCDISMLKAINKQVEELGW